MRKNRAFRWCTAAPAVHRALLRPASMCHAGLLPRSAGLLPFGVPRWRAVTFHAHWQRRCASPEELRALWRCPYRRKHQQHAGVCAELPGLCRALPTPHRSTPWRRYGRDREPMHCLRPAGEAFEAPAHRIPAVALQAFLQKPSLGPRAHLLQPPQLVLLRHAPATDHLLQSLQHRPQTIKPVRVG